MAAQTGIEPVTFRLTAGRSTSELLCIICGDMLRMRCARIKSWSKKRKQRDSNPQPFQATVFETGSSSSRVTSMKINENPIEHSGCVRPETCLFNLISEFCIQGISKKTRGSRGTRTPNPSRATVFKTASSSSRFTSKKWPQAGVSPRKLLMFVGGLVVQLLRRACFLSFAHEKWLRRPVLPWLSSL